MSLGTCALKASGETNAIAKGRHPWQPWNTLTTQTNVTLKITEISGNNLPKRILTLATKCKRGREKRVQESALIQNG